MSPILLEVNVPIFGDNQYSFLEVVKHYNDIKVGYDAPFSKFGQPDYTVLLPETKGGTVPVRDQISYSELTSEVQGLSGFVEAIGISFQVPVRKNFSATVEASLSTWKEETPLAIFQSGEVFFNSPQDKSPSIEAALNHDEYGYLNIVLNKVNDSDLSDPDSFLQNKIKRQLNKGLPVTNRLFLLRVKQVVWPSDKSLPAIRTDFEVRDDSIIIEVKNN